MSQRVTKHQNPEIAALEARWWKDWYAQDFSWEGLKAKTRSAIASWIPGIEVLNEPLLDSCSFQTLWHDEEPHLISEPGTNRRWTRLHCPYVFADGTLSPKASWSDQQWQSLEDTIVALSSDGDFKGLAWLSGAVLRKWPFTWRDSPKLLGNASAFNIVADHLYLSAPQDGSTLDRISADRFIAPQSWLGKDFHAGLSILHEANFSSAIFVGQADFSQCLFENKTNFSGARFLKVADFTKAQFTSTDTAADFSGARFSDKAEFSEVRFAHEAIFNGAKFGGRTNFYATAFEDRALFDDVECLENIHFYKAAFVRRLTINRAIFYRKFNMEGITDGDPLSLSPQPLDLSATETDGTITGLSGELKPSVGPTTQSYHVLPKILAEGAVFHYDANFSNRDIISPSTFENARFHHWARFHGSTLHPNVSLHNTHFDTALGYKPSKIVTPPEALLRLRFASLPDERDFNVWKKAFLKARLETHKGEFTYNGFYDALEASYRTLKQGMEDRRDRIREGQFFMYELRARRKRHDVPLWETAASWLYWGASDYGNSIFRPLILMGVMFVGLALVYFGMAEKAFYTGALTFPLNPDASDRLTQAFSFSLNNTFSPFSALDASKIADKDEWTSQLLLSNDAGFSLKIKGLSTLQSLLTLTLAFLAGLAGRRRFQIN